MRLKYEGVDITDSVDVRRAAYRDGSGEALDMLDVELENAASWHGWKPRRGDRMEVVEGTYSTGVLYVDTAIPDGRRYRLIAASAPGAVHARAWAAFEDRRIGDILQGVAAECGMGWAAYGVNTSAKIPYLIRANEKCSGFLARLAMLESAAMKFVGGKATMIGIAYAQNLTAAQTLEITTETPGVYYHRSEGMRLAGIQVYGARGRGKASDSGAADGMWQKVYLPVCDDIQAARWARGLLLHHNQQAEVLELNTPFNAGMTALAPVEVLGTEAMAGRWIVREAEHEFVGGTTRTMLMRSIETIQ